MGRKIIDLTNKKIGRLLVVSRAKDFVSPSGIKRPAWKCICDCGNESIVRGNHLREKKGTKSCGCLAVETAIRINTGNSNARKHGWKNHYLYSSWVDMNNRCYNKKDKSYKNYGARGISISPQWENETQFINYVLDNLGERPEGTYPSGHPLYTLDRVNNDGDYEPGNLRWATKSEQNYNRRASKINHKQRILDYEETKSTINHD